MSKQRSAILLLIGAGIGAAITALLFLLFTGEPSDETIADTASEEPIAPSLTPSAPSPWKEVLPTRDLKGDCTVAGTVFDSKGEAAEDAIVRLRLLDEPWISGNIPLEARTDAEGRFSFPGITKEAEYQVFAWTDDHAVGSHVNARCDARTDLYLDRGAGLVLRFIDENGDPVSDVLITLAGSALWPQREALSNEEGEIEFAGLEPGFYTFNATKGALAFTLLEPLELAPGDEVELEAQLAKTATAAVQVQDAQSGKPIPGAMVSVTPKNATLLRRIYRTNDVGEATVQGLAVTGGDAVAWAPGYAAADPVSVGPGETVRISMQRGITIEGRVVDPSGAPIEGATVEAGLELGAAVSAIPGGREHSFLSSMQDASMAGWPRAVRIEDNITLAGPAHIPLPSGSTEEKRADAPWAPSNADGRFVLDGLRPGALRLGASHPQYVLLRETPVTVEPNGTINDATIVMQPGVLAAIRILNREGYPIRKAEVTAYADDGEILATALSETDGYARMEGLPGGFRVGAVAEGFVPATATLSGKPGQEVETSLNLLPADKILRGRVVDKNGFGIGDATIRAKSLTKGLPHVLTGQTEQDGSFALQNAGQGSYHVEVEIDGEVQIRLASASHASELKLVVNRDHMAKPASGGYPAMVEPSMINPPGLLLPPASGADGEVSGDNLGMVAVTESQSMPGSVDASSPTSSLTTGSVNTSYGPADQLMVTGPPSGKGGLPITIRGGPGGVKIGSVQGGSAVAAAGLRPGAKLVKVDGIKVSGPAAARKAILGRIGSVVMLDVIQKGEPMSVVVQRVRVK